MNRIPTQQQVECLRKNYPVGTRVVLHSMDDPYAPVPPGTYARLKPGDQGTVVAVDDIGTVHIDWDNGSGLSLVPGEDTFSKVSEPEKAKSDRGMSR